MTRRSFLRFLGVSPATVATVAASVPAAPRWIPMVWKTGIFNYGTKISVALTVKHWWTGAVRRTAVTIAVPSEYKTDALDSARRYLLQWAKQLR